MLNRRGKDAARSFAIACLVSVILVLSQMGIFCPGVTAATPVANAGNYQESSKNSLFAGNVILDGSVSSDTGADNLVLEWFGPFGVATGVSPSVQIPQGTYTVSLRAVGCPESSGIATAEITIAPAFTIAARSKWDVVQLTWTHISGMIRYDVYRASENDPCSFEKIAETTSTYSTYLDDTVINESNYLYAVAAIDSDGVAYYSNMVASCAPATRATVRLNRPPLIYSPAITSGTAGMIYEYTVLAADANNRDILSYSLTEAPPGMTIDGVTGKIRWAPTDVGSFQVIITAADGNGLCDSQSFNIAISAPAPTVELVAKPGIIMPGQAGQESSTLSWCSTNANFCTIAPDVGQVNPIGNVAVQPAETTEYSITAHGLGGTATDHVTVAVNPPVIPPPTIDILANPQAISLGDTSRLCWHSTHAETVTIDQGVGSVALNSDEAPGFGTVVSPRIDTIYTIIATGPGGTATDSVTVTVTVLPPTVDISASLELILLGQPTRLFWHSTHADSVEIDQEIGTVAVNSAESDMEIITYPQTTTTYTITATGPGGIATDSVTVNVDTIPPPSVDIIAMPDQLGQGENSWLYWHSTHADTVTIDQNIGTVAANGCFGGQDDGYPGIVSGECSEGKQVVPQTTTTYTITATGLGGTATDSVTITVSDVPPPTVDMVAIPESIEAGESSWLYWHSSDADTITIDQGIGPVAANGCYGGKDEGFREGAGEDCGMGERVRPQTTTTYTITATGPGGTATDTVTVHVSEPVPPTVEIVADPETINSGGQSWLYWHSTHAELISISQNIGVVAANGCYRDDVLAFPLEGGDECGQGVPVSPTVTTTYTITAIGLGGIATDTVTVTVANVPPPTVTITANPSVINAGETSWLVWYATNTESVSIDQGVDAYCSGDGGVRSCWDSVAVSPTITTTYTITATGPGGSATASVTVYVDELPPLTVTITANPEAIDPGETSWLEWYATNAENISIDQGVNAYCTDYDGYGGYSSPTASWNIVPVSPIATTTYTITATGPGGTVTDAVTVTVDDGGVPSAVFFAEPSYIFRGSSTTLRWQTTNADTVIIDQGIGAVTVNSDENGQVVSPDTTTTYTLTATGPEGQGSTSVTVLVFDPLPPLVDFVAWPMSVKLDEKSTLVWGSISADRLIIETDIGPDIGEVDLNSHIEVVPPTTTTYTISASGPGGSVTESLTIQVLPQISYRISDRIITAGDSSMLTINTVNGETVSIDHGVGDVQMSAGAEYKHSGTVSLTPLEKTTYTITATGNGGTSTASVTIDVQPRVEFYSDREIIELGTQAHLHWTTLQADTVKITPDWGELALNSEPGGLAVSPVKKTTYSINACGPTRCTSVGGVTVYVNDFSKPPVVTYLYASPSTINPGETAKLRWETANMQAARIDNGVGDVPMFGSFEVSPERTTTYTLVVRGPQGLVAEQITVRVSGTRELGTFGAKYEEIVSDAAVDLTAERFSILTGHCKDRDGKPIAGVSVSAFGVAEFGEVFTDDQGRYSLPVMGNNRYTVAMAKEGFLSAHRKAEVLNNRIAVLDTPTLIEPDRVSTVIDFTANPEPVLFHGGRYLVDERGQRRLALTIPASETFVEPRNIVTTEYATQAALPAPLPPNTPYTYVAEIGIDQYDDGATVSFHEPAIAWVDNFLGFPIGQRVPVGWYDQHKGQWIPCENGLVVRLLDIDSDGSVDGLDINGDQQADDLDADGDYADEVAGLPPGEVQVGATFYRFGVDRTGSWALSWPYASMDTPAPTYDRASCPSDACELVEQDIAIPGTEFYLHYAEARTSAYQPIVTIPVTNESVPANVEAMLVRMTVAGKVYEQERSAEPGQTIQIQWDGMDYLGQAVTGSVTAEIAIGYVYDRNYAHAGGFNHAFSQAGNGDVAIACREKYVAWHRQRIQLDRFAESDDFIADGWTLSAQHQTIHSGPATLYLGNGDLLLNDRLMSYDSFICGGYIYNPLTDENYGEFGAFSGIAVNSGGTVLLSDSNFDVIWRYDADRGFDYRFDSFIPNVHAGDYTRHSEHLLNNPMGVAIDGFTVYYAETGNHVIRQGASGLFAGNGQEGYSGDGQGRLGAALDSPSQLALDHWGNLYIIDQDNHVIRRVSTDGIIETIAGNGTDGSDGDNGPALGASISPADIAIDARGNIFIAEPTFSKVRQIDVSGIITTVAGTGARGQAGVGGAAALAELIEPKSVAVDSLGKLYISDRQRLLEVDGNSLLQETISDRDLSSVDVMTTDMQDRLFLGKWSVHRVSRPQFSDMAERDFYKFMDSSGQEYHFSALGKHHYTGSPYSPYHGPKHTFVYNLDYLLVSVLDHNGEAILTINRDGAGRVLSLESSEGVTTLTVDENNHLVGLRRPDDASATLTYNDQGLLTDFATAFTGSIQGVVTDGVTGLPLGDITVNLTTNQGSTSQQTAADGSYGFADLAPGEYSLECHHADYFKQSLTGAIAFGSDPLTHDVAMLFYYKFPPEVVVFKAEPRCIRPGDPYTIFWEVKNAYSVEIGKGLWGGQGMAPVGSLVDTGEWTHNYYLKASGPGGETGFYVTMIEVLYSGSPPPWGTIHVTPNVIAPGESATLSWDARYARRVTINNDALNDYPLSGSMTVSPNETTEYVLSVYSEDVQFSTLNTYATVLTVTGPPTINVSASPDTILAGESTMLEWNAFNADTVSIDNGVGSVATSGTYEVTPTETTTYTLTATGPEGTATNSVTVTVLPPITLQITSPTDGATIDRPDVMVQGTFICSTGNEIGITVNGVLASIFGNQFVANGVPLSQGENTFTAVATDTDGNTRSTSVDVSVALATDYIRVSATAESGVSPLETNLIIDGSFSITESSISYGGPGVVDFLKSGDDEYSIRLTEPGLYYFTVEVVNDTVTYSDTVAVMVVDKSLLDETLKAVFSGVKTALAAGDVEGAVALFTSRSREKYRTAFDALSDKLQQIASDMQDIEQIYVYEDMAKYRIRRPHEINGEMVDITYYIYFRVDMDGVWRIAQF